GTAARAFSAAFEGIIPCIEYRALITVQLADKVPQILSAWALQTSPSQPKDRAMERKIEELTWRIKDQKDVNPGLYIERAWLYAENMMFDEAFHDLAVAIANSGAGMAIDARWLRAQIWLLTDSTELALKDLEAITDSSKTHLGAFHAKAKLYQELGGCDEGSVKRRKFYELLMNCISQTW
ncbi:MAG: hypothetical protein BJ554DRAFT_1707, partial [Olpidium bornovanus]